MSSTKPFRCEADTRGEARLFFALLLLPAMTLVSAVVADQTFEALPALGGSLLAVSFAYRSWREAKQAYLEADGRGVTVVERDGRRELFWGPDSVVEMHREIAPGIVRLVRLRDGAGALAETLSVSGARYCIPVEKLHAGLEAARLESVRGAGR